MAFLKGNLFRNLSAHWCHRICVFFLCRGFGQKVISYLRHLNRCVSVLTGLCSGSQGPSVAILIRPQMPCLHSDIKGAYGGTFVSEGMQFQIGLLTVIQCQNLNRVMTFLPQKTARAMTPLLPDKCRALYKTQRRKKNM